MAKASRNECPAWTIVTEGWKGALDRAVGCALFALALLVFRRGVNRYDSSGSQLRLACRHSLGAAPKRALNARLK